MGEVHALGGMGQGRLRFHLTTQSGSFELRTPALGISTYHFRLQLTQVTKTAARGSCVSNYTGFSVVLEIIIYWIHYFRLSVILSWESRGRLRESVCELSVPSV